jgi:hypothetical protein
MVLQRVRRHHSAGAVQDVQKPTPCAVLLAVAAAGAAAHAACTMVNRQLLVLCFPCNMATSSNGGYSHSIAAAAAAVAAAKTAGLHPQQHHKQQHHKQMQVQLTYNNKGSSSSSSSSRSGCLTQLLSVLASSVSHTYQRCEMKYTVQ